MYNEGDIVLDPFVGIGFVPIACKITNREFIGSEIDKKYYDICLDRVKELNN